MKFLCFFFCFAGGMGNDCDLDFGLWPQSFDVADLSFCFPNTLNGECVVADPGKNLQGLSSQQVSLDGSGSTVPHHPEALSFQWRQLENGAPTIVLNDAATAMASFTAAVAGVYLFELQTDWLCKQDTAQVQVTVTDLSGPPAAVNAVQIAAVSSPVQVTFSAPGDDRVFIVSKGGRILIYSGGSLLPTPFLDLSPTGLNLVSNFSEQGLLGLAFDPDYTNNGDFYVNYTGIRPDGGGSSADTRIVAFKRDTLDPNLADPASASLLLSVSQPESNHNGGQLLFGPDGMLYIGMGDGGGGGDVHGIQGNGQNPLALLGKMLRIQVNGPAPYSIPVDNPFVGDPSTLDEIWALGLRNPWRFSFDRQSGDLYIADVGQGAWEEIDVQPATSSGGENYGWRLKEGLACFNPSTNCDPGGLTDPVHVYNHSMGRCSVTGGFVYRGVTIPLLDGFYIFADFCSGDYYSMFDDGGSWEVNDFGVFVNNLPLTSNVQAFGVDHEGELYICTVSNVYKITEVRP